MPVQPGMISGGRTLVSPAADGSAGHVLKRGATADSTEWAAASGGASEIDINTQTAGYTLQTSDLGDLVDFTTAGVTLTLLAAATAGDKFYCYVRHSGAVTTVLTVDGDGSETIDGATTLVMFAGEVRLLICTGSAWVSQEIDRPWRGVFTKPVDSAFAWINQSTATIATTRGGLLLRDDTPTSGFNWRIRKKAAPSTPYTITAAFMLGVADSGLAGGGLCFRQSSDGKLHGFEVQFDTSILYVDSRKLASPTSFSADYTLAQHNGRLLGPMPIWLRIADNGTNRICSWSYDGENFFQFHSVGRTDYLTADEVGFHISPNTRAAAMTLLSWREA